MKKILFGFVLIFGIIISSMSVFAGQTNNVQLEITGGIKYYDKAESTFDEERSITGLVEEGATVDIYVYTKNIKGELVERNVYAFDVGASGIFSQNVNLYIGENVITISAMKEGKETTSTQATIKRKKQEIKKELENSISIPGESIKSSSVSILSFIK